MEVILLCKSRIPERFFDLPSLLRMLPAELDHLLAEPPSDTVVYVDAASFPKKTVPELVARLAASKRLHWAVIDRAQLIADPASFFHAGAVDYIAGEAPDGLVNMERLRTLTRFAARQEPSGMHARGPRARMNTFPGWNALVEGREYDFLLVHMGLSDADGLHTRLGESRFARLKSNVLAILSGLATEHDGLVWMGDDSSALSLFPADTVAQVFRSCLGILANLKLISYEQFRLEQESIELSFDMYRTSIPWQKPGQTGTLVSDAINFIYHLGRKFTPPGVIDLVGETSDLLPDRLEDQVFEAGIFEGKRVVRFPGFATTGG